MLLDKTNKLHSLYSIINCIEYMTQQPQEETLNNFIGWIVSSPESKKFFEKYPSIQHPLDVIQDIKFLVLLFNLYQEVMQSNISINLLYEDVQNIDNYLPCCLTSENKHMIGLIEKIDKEYYKILDSSLGELEISKEKLLAGYPIINLVQFVRK